MKVIPSIEEQCAFVRNIASRCAKVNFKATNAKLDYHFGATVGTDKVAASSVRGKMKDIQHICKGGGEVVPTSVVEVIDLFRDVVETKCNNAKLMDRNNDLLMGLDESRAPEQFARDRVERADACVEGSEKHMETSASRYSKAA